MPPQNTLPFFRQKRILSSLNVPRKYQPLVGLLRALSILPCALHIIKYIQIINLIPFRDAGGSLIIDSTRLEYGIATVWCVLAGYWNWILTTSMMKRWLYHYEINHALVRLFTLTIVSWCMSGLVNTAFEKENPIKVQMIICGILLLFNLFKLKFGSSPKYSQKLEDALPTSRFNLKSTAIKILLLPLLGVVFISAVGLTAETNRFQYNAIQLMRDTKFELDTAVESASIMVLILSSWSSQAAEKRQVLRDSALRWTTGANITYRFVLGQPPSSNAQSWMGPKLVSESEKYNDLLVVPAPDLQSDKSKKLLEALKWSVQADYDYLIKTEDDVFVRWDLIPFELKNQKKENYWKGFVYRNMPLNYFDKGTNMGVDFGLPVLPAFTSGIFYTLSRDVVKMITEFPYPQRYVDDDGVNLAIWLFGFNIEPMHDRRIQSGKDVCEKDLVAKKVDYHPKDMKAMYTSISNQQSICHGFRHETCGLCYPCYEKTNNWRADNLHCDPERGVSLTKQPDFIQMAGPNVKDMLEPSKIGDSDRWIIPDILSTRSSVYSETDKWHLLYWVCWTSDPSTFTDRHWRALEMVWIHEPEAAIIMMTNTLPTNFFQDYTRRGYNIQVVQFNKQNLLNWNWYFGPGTKDWIADWDKWEKGKFFYWHLTDYIRLLLLYNYGGTYMDMDALWIRVPPDTNQEFIGSDYSSLMSDREWTLDDQGLYLPQGLMRFKRGWKLFREMAEDAFSAYTYDPECFNCGGPKAITSYVRKRRGVLESAGFTILPRKTFYPFNYLEIHHLLEPNPLAEQEMKKNIEPYSWNIHLFGKMTNNLPVQPGSVIDFVFKKFDLDLPHRDTKTHNIISSSHGWTVPFALVGPRDYVFQQLTDRMMEDDRKRNNTLILQQKIGRFQGLNVIYVRGGPDKYDDVKINLETTIGRNRFSGNFTKHTSMHLKGASMKDVNSMLNRIEYQPTKLMAANGGRDKIKIQLEYQYGNTLAQEQLEFPVIVIEPLEENDDPLLDPLPSTKNK